MLKIDDVALVIVDVQGKLATLMHDKEAFYDNLVKIINGAKALGIPILWNEQLPDKLGPTIPQVKGAMSNLRPLVKNTFSCCGNPEFNRVLSETGRKQVVLAGMETHVCVYQTTLDLLGAGYDVYVVADAVSSRTLQNKQIALQAVRDAGAKISSVEMALFSMLRVAEGDKFKQILQIVK